VDLEDIFKHAYRKKGSNHYNGGHFDDGHGLAHTDSRWHKGHDNHKIDLARSIIKALPHKKALLAGALIISAIVLTSVIGLLWFILPLMAQAVGYVEANGIRGLVDAVLPFAEKLWSGNG
jgi:hypothetical protein